MPQQRSTREYVFLGIRLICYIAFFILAFFSYRHDGMIGLISLGSIIVINLCLDYSKGQGMKLAARNMKKAGLKPDRDEELKSL